MNEDSVDDSSLKPQKMSLNEIPNYIELHEYTLSERKEFTERTAELKVLRESGSITSEEYENKILNALGVQVTQEGDVILYHVTTAEFLPAIISNHLLQPAIETGATVLRTPHEERSTEETDLDKKRKIYLATQKEAVGIARGINRPFTVQGGTYVFEVHVEKDYLTADEDSEEKTWVDSLGKIATCAYRGSIADFEVFGRMLPVPVNHYDLIDRIERSSGAEKIEAQKEYDDNVALLDRELRLDLVQRVGFDTNSIPIIK